MDISSLIRTVPNFPKEGIMFKDITTLLKDAKGFQAALEEFYNLCKDKNLTKIVGIESRGFIFKTGKSVGFIYPGFVCPYWCWN